MPNTTLPAPAGPTARLEATNDVRDRIRTLDWSEMERSLRARGWAETPPVLTAEECAELRETYDDASRFRSRVVMARHRFGEGEYQYLAAPLPPIVQALRETLYPPLARVANAWAEALGDATRFPYSLDAFLARCAAAGQTRPTPLLLRYGAGGYNCLHQDVYGDVAFPLQVVVALSRPREDYDGGEFLLVEQRPRAQSVAQVIVPPQGAMVAFTTRTRPVAGTRGHYRANVRHGVSLVRRGSRMMLGVIFHDAR